MDLGTFTKISTVLHIHVGDFMATIIGGVLGRGVVVWEKALCNFYGIYGINWATLNVRKFTEIISCKKTPDSRYILSVRFMKYGSAVPEIANIELFPKRYELNLNREIRASYDHPFLHIWPKKWLDFCSWSDVHKMQTLHEYRLLWKIFTSKVYSTLPEDIKKLILTKAFKITILNLIHVRQSRNTVKNDCISLFYITGKLLT